MRTTYPRPGATNLAFIDPRNQSFASQTTSSPLLSEGATISDGFTNTGPTSKTNSLKVGIFSATEDFEADAPSPTKAHAHAQVDATAIGFVQDMLHADFQRVNTAHGPVDIGVENNSPHKQTWTLRLPQNTHSPTESRLDVPPIILDAICEMYRASGGEQSLSMMQLSFENQDGTLTPTMRREVYTAEQPSTGVTLDDRNVQRIETRTTSDLDIREYTIDLQSHPPGTRLSGGR